MRLIDADLIEEHFKKVIKHYEKGESSLCKTKRKLLEGAFRDVLARIESQPTVEERPTGKWIPVNEKLPERNKDVLCWAKSTARGGDICFVGSCDKGCWFLQSSAGHQSYPSQYKVVAWMELPEPYKKGEE